MVGREMNMNDMDMKDLTTPYSLDPGRNKVDPRAGIIPEWVDMNAPFREPLAKFAKVVTDRKNIKHHPYMNIIICFQPKD